jgi:pantoate--beta-alanine ligase
MSSRNERLSAQERDEAAIIYQILTSVKAKFPTNSAAKTSEWVEKFLKKNPQFTLEYFTISDEATLISCNRKNKNKKYRAFIAVLVNNIRLIDTISLN